MYNIKECDVLLTFNKKKMFSYLISMFRDDHDIPKISHAIIYLGNGKIAEAVNEGVVIVDIEKYFSKKYELYVLRCAEEFDKKKLIEYCNSVAGKFDYSFLQLIALFFKKIFNLKKVGDVEKKAMICSELVDNAFKSVGVTLVNGKNSAEVTPFDFFKSNKLEFIGKWKKNDKPI